MDCGLFHNFPFEVIWCGSAEATGLGFVYFVVINPCVQPTELISAFLFHKFSNFTPPPPPILTIQVLDVMAQSFQYEEVQEETIAEEERRKKKGKEELTDEDQVRGLKIMLNKSQDHIMTKD